MNHYCTPEAFCSSNSQNAVLKTNQTALYDAYFKADHLAQSFFLYTYFFLAQSHTTSQKTDVNMSIKVFQRKCMQNRPSGILSSPGDRTASDVTVIQVQIMIYLEVILRSNSLM